MEYIKTNMKLTRFCLKSICGNLRFRSVTRYQYSAIHLRIAKLIWAILIYKKSKKLVWLVKKFQVGPYVV